MAPHSSGGGAPPGPESPAQRTFSAALQTLRTATSRRSAGSAYRLPALLVICGGSGWRELCCRGRVHAERISLISEYCDRWCERCAYTERCSTFATRIAIAMCGDVREGLELAIGRPHPVGVEPAPSGAAWLASLPDVEPTAEEQAELTRREEAREARLEATPLLALAEAVSALAYDWLKAHYPIVRAHADEVLGEALEVALYDATFVGPKVHRALHGRDEFQHGEAVDDGPVQNDWNGTAKVVLLSLDRSEVAWRVIAAATAEDIPAVVADQLADLRREVEEAFPNARRFVRPGFDEPWR